MIYEEIKNDRIVDMQACLEEYAECAGFSGYYDRMLKTASEEEIKEAFFNQFYKGKRIAGKNSADIMRSAKAVFNGIYCDEVALKHVVGKDAAEYFYVNGYTKLSSFVDHITDDMLVGLAEDIENGRDGLEAYIKYWDSL